MNVNEKKPVRPRIQNIDKFSQTKPLQIVQNDNACSASVQCLTELLCRTLDQNQGLLERIGRLKQGMSTLQATLN